MADTEHFMSIYPRNKEYKGVSNLEPIPLRIVRSSGFNVDTDIKFSKVTLENNNKVFRNQSGEQDSFSITVIIHTNDRLPAVEGLTKKRVIPAFDYWIRNAEPFYVVTQAISIPSDELWLVTEQKTRKQPRKDGYVYWDLTFTKYKVVNLGKFNVTSKGVNAAKKEYNAAQATARRNNLKKCKRDVLVYSGTKKIVSCVKTLQELLYYLGCYPSNTKKSKVCTGWYHTDTVKAVKNYQKQHKYDYGLKETGKVDYNTFQCLIGNPTKAVTVTDLASQVAGTVSKTAVNGKNVSVTNVNVTPTVTGTVGDLGVMTQNLTTVTVKSTSMASQAKATRVTGAKKTSTATKKTSK